MYVSNRVDFGHLINADNFDTTRTNSEVYQLFDNRWDWEQRYIHDNYTENFNPNNTIQQVKNYCVILSNHIYKQFCLVIPLITRLLNIVYYN